MNHLAAVDAVKLGEGKDAVAVKRRLECEVEAGEHLMVDSLAITSATLTRRFSPIENSSGQQPPDRAG
jgi:hypothetical protein